MKRILVLGSNGQLADALKRLGGSHDIRFIGQGGLNLLEIDQIADTLREIPFDLLINCMAYTAVDTAEVESEKANSINAEAVGILAEICRDRTAELIHISTDYVFGNALPQPIREDHPTKPTGAYGSSKLAGELLIGKKLKEHIIIRTSWLYGAHGHNFLKTMLRLGAERSELGLVYDQVGSPTWVDDLAKAILKIAEKPELREHYGTYHFSNEGLCSWYDFAKAIFDLNEMSVRVKPILSSQFPTPAARPAYSVLDKSKIKETFGIEIPHWRDSLVSCLQTMHPAHA